MNTVKTTVIAGVLSLVYTLGYGQNTSVDVPKDSKLLLHVYGKGIQVYVCAPMAGDSSRYVWTLTEAKAGLYSSDTYQAEVGKHYFNAEHHPVWEATDGSKVVGNKLRQADAPAAGAVPWLLLRAVTTPGNDDNGALKGTTFIQRTHTNGGKAPDGGADAAHKGQTIQVPYTAEYLFYTGS